MRASTTRLLLLLPLWLQAADIEEARLNTAFQYDLPAAFRLEVEGSWRQAVPAGDAQSWVTDVSLSRGILPGLKATAEYRYRNEDEDPDATRLGFALRYKQTFWKLKASARAKIQREHQEEKEEIHSRLRLQLKYPNSSQLTPFVSYEWLWDTGDTEPVLDKLWGEAGLEYRINDHHAIHGALLIRTTRSIQTWDRKILELGYTLSF